MTVPNLKIASFECTACGTVHQTPGGLPVGWSQHARAVWCGNCTALGIPARDMGRNQNQPRRVA